MSAIVIFKIFDTLNTYKEPKKSNEKQTAKITFCFTMLCYTILDVLFKLYNEI